MKRKILTSIGALLFLGAATSASMAANTQTANMNARIKIIEGCSEMCIRDSFGVYANLRAPRRATAEVIVSCNVKPGTTDSGLVIAERYKVTLSPGKSANQAVREMRNTNGNAVKYNIYVNSNYSGIFGDGTGSTSTLENAITDTTDDHYIVYGLTQVDTNNPVPGEYVDNLTLTVLF